MRRKLRVLKVKIATAATSAVVVTVGAGICVSTYTSGVDFIPKYAQNSVKSNQVLFSGNEDTKDEKNSKDNKNDESRYYQKDKKSNEKQTPQKDKNADYLFEEQKKHEQAHTQSETVAVAGNTLAGGLENGNYTQSADSLYSITDNAENADMVISSENGTIISGISEGESTTDGNEENKNTNTGEGENQGERNENSTTPSKPSDTQKPSQTPDTKPSKPSGGGAAGGSESSPTTPTNPSNTRPADTAKDPENSKGKPSYVGELGGNYNDKVIDEINKAGGTESSNVQVMILQAMSTSTDRALYKGQSVDEKTIYNALDTYLRISDGTNKNVKNYLWTESDYNKYIRIKEVSFDGGKTWNNTFPVTIPEDVKEGDMLIRVEYKYAESDKNWNSTDIKYLPQDSRIYILKEKLTQNNTTLEKDNILNYGSIPTELGQKLNLFARLNSFLPSGEKLTKLFPGWTENGKIVPWFYITTSGRHILEPADMVSIDSKYNVELKTKWLDDDMNVCVETPIPMKYRNLGYLQVLTYVDDKTFYRGKRDYIAFDYDSSAVLAVPKYVQGIEIDEDKKLSADALQIPDTVLYIDNSNNNMLVKSKYEVDKGNINYASTSNGWLVNKEDTEVLGIPYNEKEVVIPSGYTKVKIQPENQIKTIYIEGNEIDALPSIEYGNLKNCKIVVDDDILFDFINNQYEEIAQNIGNTFAAASNPDFEYRIENSMLVDDNGKVYKMFEKNAEMTTLPENTKFVSKNTFSLTPNVTKLVIPSSKEDITFEEGFFADTNINIIICCSQEQKEAIEAQIEKEGRSGEIEVKYATEFGEYTYYVDEFGQNVLLTVPKDITEFNGIITNEEGEEIEINRVSDSAFENCRELKWLDLGESVNEIGYNSFKNCTSLEGIVVGNKTKFVLGNEAFEGCDSLRFFASNAYEMEAKDNYCPIIKEDFKESYSFNSYIYIPTNNNGYTYGVYFDKASDVVEYKLVDIGSTKALYGVGMSGDEWLAIRAGKELSGKLNLPGDTVELYANSFSNTTGNYTIDFDGIVWLDGACFKESGLTGDIVLNNVLGVGDEAFSGCNITSVEFKQKLNSLGNTVFCNSKKLETVKFTDFGVHCNLYSASFTGCDSLTDIYFDKCTGVPQLTLVGLYCFNANWDNDYEAERLRLHVKEGMEEEYVKQWKYGFLGFSSYFGSPYMSLYNSLKESSMDEETWEPASDEEIRQMIEERILWSENRIRKLMGVPTVDKPTDLYHINEDSFFSYRLISTAYNAEEMDFTNADFLYNTVYIELSGNLDYISKGAFSNSKNLKNVKFYSTVKSIESGAFEGVESDRLNIEFEDDFLADKNSIPELTMIDGEPFSFGIDESRIHITVPLEKEEEYIGAWEFALAGYNNMSDMREKVYNELVEDGIEAPTNEQIESAIKEKLMSAENRLRKMMGMDEITSVEQLVCTDFSSENTNENIGGATAGEIEKDNELKPSEGEELEPDNGNGEDNGSNNGSDENSGEIIEEPDENNGENNNGNNDNSSNEGENTDISDGNNTENSSGGNGSEEDNNTSSGNGSEEDNNTSSDNSGEESDNSSDSGESGEGEEN